MFKMAALRAPRWFKSKFLGISSELRQTRVFGMSPFSFRSFIQPRKPALFLFVFLSLLLIHVFSTYTKRDGEHQTSDYFSLRSTDDAALLTYLYPRTSIWAGFRNEALMAIPTQPKANPTPPSIKLTITQRQRSMHVVYRLSIFKGTRRGNSRAMYGIVSLFGILGMFSAIVGAVLGPWMADVSDEVGDDERFIFWAREEDDEEEDQRICGVAREEKYFMLRVLDVT